MNHWAENEIGERQGCLRGAALIERTIRHLAGLLIALFQRPAPAEDPETLEELRDKLEEAGND